MKLPTPIRFARLRLSPPRATSTTLLGARRTLMALLLFAQAWTWHVLDSRTAVADGPTEESGVSHSAEDLKFFEERIRPILAEHCLECHGGETQESGLRLDSRAAVLRGADGERLVVDRQRPRESRMVQAVRGEGDLERMPPDGELTREQVELLVSWIERNLPWPTDSAVLDPGLTARQRYQSARERHWSFQPIERPTLPHVEASDWAGTPIDVYILEGLEGAGLEPSPPADRRTLVRRLTFDLHGLPPTPEEAERFAGDPSPDAYARLVERLLASPRYGERWGRHWLDVARYADTRGYSFGRERKFAYAYTYRDYVIRSLNADKPYDLFVKEQLAADLMPGRDSRSLAALGLLTVGRQFNNRHDDIDDQIDVVGRGLLGLTIACARCHDHKYDAIPTEDYYSLYGVFASCEQPSELPLIGDPSDVPGYDRYRRELEKRRGELDKFVERTREELLDAFRRQTVEYLARIVSKEPEEILRKLPFISLGDRELRPKLLDRWREFLRERAKDGDPVLSAWQALTALEDDEFSQRSTTILERLAATPEGLESGQVNPLVKQALVKQALAEQRLESRVDVARVYGELFTEVYDLRKTSGDDAPLSDAQRQIGEIVWGEESPTNVPRSDIREYLNRAQRNRMRELQKQVDSHEANSTGAPPRAMVVRDHEKPHDPHVFVRGNHRRKGKSVPRQFVRVLAGDDREPFEGGSGRLELAEAIVAPDNPLTRRVIANRVWMHHFGESLVDTPSDLGTRCPPPAQAKVLDYLAWSLGDGEWSLKKLHREIVLSSVYRQASLDRPEARRKDPENRLYWRANRRRLEYEAMRDALFFVSGRLDPRMHGRGVDLLEAPYAGRRAVYGFVDRQDLPNLLRVFDFASPDQSSPRRPETTVPQQALFLMNSPLVAERAESLASREEVERSESPSERVRTLYRLVFTREPTAEETEIGLRFVESCVDRSSDRVKMSPWQQYSQMLLLTNEFMFVD